MKKMTRILSFGFYAAFVLCFLFASKGLSKDTCILAIGLMAIWLKIQDA